MSGAYPPGCTQAMHDRAFGDEEREACQACGGARYITVTDFDDRGGCEYETECKYCHGTGFEPAPDTSEDDAYDQSREDADDDIAF